MNGPGYDADNCPPQYDGDDGFGRLDEQNPGDNGRGSPAVHVCAVSNNRRGVAYHCGHTRHGYDSDHDGGDWAVHQTLVCQF